MLKITAKILAVLMSENDSITCGLDVSGKNDEMKEEVNEYVNLTLRFDGDEARLAGFPQNWTLGADYENEFDAPKISEVYISKADEREILVQLKASLQKQFEDEMFKDTLTENQKNIALDKINNAISDFV